MGEIVFVDTSAWVGVFVASDQHHAAARAAVEELERERPLLVTTDYVLAETVTRVRMTAGLAAACRVWDELEGGAARLLDVEPAHRLEARRLSRKFSQIPLSLVDCVSLAVMRELGTRRILTFDADFWKAGCAVLPA
jgi:hypothetical protein